MIKNKDTLINNSQDENIRRARRNILDAIEYIFKRIDAKEVVKQNIDKIQSIIIKRHTNNIYVISLGKAAIPMAQAVAERLDVADGVVITNKQCECVKIPCIRSSHPVPSQKSIEAAERMKAIVKKANKKDLIIFLISGGGSALAEIPRVSLEDMQKTTDVLIKHSLNINEINCIRKHLSAIKGGQIMRNAESRIVSLLISDVIGDDLSTIASGLTYYDETTFDDALRIIKNHGLEEKIPVPVFEFLKEQRVEFETLKKYDFPFEKVDNFIISNNDKTVLLAEEFFKGRCGIVYVHMGITKDVKNAAEDMARKIKTMAEADRKPAVFVAGGEVSVNVKGRGVGGRNQELAMLLTKKLKDVDVVCAAFATDGKDGNSQAAGALFDKYTLKRAEKLGLHIENYIKNNDAYNFFDTLKDCIFTEDTKTNIADLLFCIKL